MADSPHPLPEVSGLDVAVVGAGNGGLAIAGYAGLGGARVRLYDVVAARVDPVRATGGIAVTGAVSGFAPVAVATTDPAAAVDGADLVVLVVAGPDQAQAADDLAAHMPASAPLLVKPGCTGGALEVREVLARRGRSDVTVGETDSFLFACNVPGPGASHISAIKRTMGVAVLPPSRASELLSSVRALFPEASLLPSVLHSAFSNMNAVAHVGPMLLNAGRIEHLHGQFEFYGDGITPAVAQVVSTYDMERVAAASAFGVSAAPFEEWVSETYGIGGSSVYEIIQRLQHEVYRSSPAPATLAHRYLLEDVPCGAVPTASLGKAAGVPMPIHESLIELAGIVHGCDYWSVGRTAERLGLAGRDAAQISELVSVS